MPRSDFEGSTHKASLASEGSELGNPHQRAAGGAHQKRGLEGLALHHGQREGGGCADDAQRDAQRHIFPALPQVDVTPSRPPPRPGSPARSILLRAPLHGGREQSGAASPCPGS